MKDAATMKEELRKLIDVAAGRVPADLVIKNCKIVNVFSGKIQEGNIAFSGNQIAGIGDYEGVQLCNFVIKQKKTAVVKPDTSNKKIQKITLSAISKQIASGKKVTLKPTVLPANASNKKLTWKSSNIKVATVTQGGVVTLKKNTGGKKVTITATATDGSRKSASWQITSMKGIVKKVKITGSKSVKAGKKLKLKAKVTATKKAKTKLRWTSGNTKYATVNAKGIVKTKKTARGKSVKITAMATDGSGKKQSVKIKIKK